MAVTKLQVNINNLINRNKASLGMYDDICQVFNDYVSSGGFEEESLWDGICSIRPWQLSTSDQTKLGR
jgi:hypothetical protein